MVNVLQELHRDYFISRLLGSGGGTCGRSEVLIPRSWIPIDRIVGQIA